MQHKECGDATHSITWTIPSPRLGDRPLTSTRLPHCQLDQWPPAEVYRRVIDYCLSVPGIREQESRMSSADTKALCIPSDRALGPESAFIDDHEFCHIHALPEGSILLTAPAPLRHRAIELGWAEQHILAKTRAMPETLLLVYGPRDENEAEVVCRIILASCRFALGE